ncbi:radical SAM family heme chaperone HemW [Desulfotalea psychrophila]|nr:radical SAM family heme chaperone HemW [Desulfotalea psychrophila]
MSSLYLHIPFCRSKCRYCAFNSYSGQGHLFVRYIAALKRELSFLFSEYGGRPLDTVFFGGGTPTVLGAAGLVEILDHCQQLWGWSKQAEISTEANPETVSAADLILLRRGGFNRISFGVQSLSDHDLLSLGRAHSAARAIQALEDARQAGFDNINLDLMSGLHGQSLQDWRRVLTEALTLKPDHLSVYQLTPEEGTPYYDDVMAGRALVPEDDLSLAMDALTWEMCRQAGLAQYEVSNYAQSGKKCRHNVNYWLNSDSLAAGAGAVSFNGGQRARRLEDPAEYCQCVEAGHSPIVESEELDREASFRETVIVGLRMIEGIEIQSLQDRYGIDLPAYYGVVLTGLLAAGLVELAGGFLRITDQGRPLSNQILEKLV